MADWRTIDSAPKDGTWFLIINAQDGLESCEAGRYEPQFFDRYIPVGDGLFRKENTLTWEWRGFNNFHRATHWQPLPAPPDV